MLEGELNFLAVILSRYFMCMELSISESDFAETIMWSLILVMLTILGLQVGSPALGLT